MKLTLPKHIDWAKELREFTNKTYENIARASAIPSHMLDRSDAISLTLERIFEKRFGGCVFVLEENDE